MRSSRLVALTLYETATLTTRFIFAHENDKVRNAKGGKKQA
jgi:hypothetical protein